MMVGIGGIPKTKNDMVHSDHWMKTIQMFLTLSLLLTIAKIRSGFNPLKLSHILTNSVNCSNWPTLSLFSDMA